MPDKAMPLLVQAGERRRPAGRQLGVDKTSQIGSCTPDLDYRAHGGPVFRTLMRTIIETGIF
jgi:hypothetical protein